MTEDEQGFQAPQTITPDGLADDLAVLVWESFTDFISEWEGASTLAEPGLIEDEGQPNQRAVEEALIFLMWAHTRGTQQAFVGRAPADLLKRALDGLHDAVLEDMVDNGTPRAQLPHFEKRVSMRYAQYHTAGGGIRRRLGGGRGPSSDRIRRISGALHSGCHGTRAGSDGTVTGLPRGRPARTVEGYNPKDDRISGAIRSGVHGGSNVRSTSQLSTPSISDMALRASNTI